MIPSFTDELARLTYLHIHELGRHPDDEDINIRHMSLKLNGQIVTGKFVGEGGTKRAFSIGDGRVLLIPQRECCS
jgi:hypothetical protein